MSPPVNLSTGACRLRIDFIQESSFWDTQNALVVTYSGPSFNSTSLPLNRLSTHRVFSNGSVEYANPSFNSTRFLPSTNSVLYIGGTGLVLANNGANVLIAPTGVVDVHDDVTWFSHFAFGSTSNFFNYGLMRKTGDDGVATFVAHYSSRRSGSLVSYRGLLEFKDSSKDGGLAMWNNPGGGNWDVASNWLPQRVPRPNDIVYINVEGVYHVIIGGHTNVSVMSLEIGSAVSQPELIVGHFAVLNVADRFDVNSATTTINGRVRAKHVAFRGETIRGSSYGGELIITSHLAFDEGLYGLKYLRQINVSVGESIDIGNNLDDNRYHLYCDRCCVINEAGSTFTTNRMQMSTISSVVSSATATADGFRYGLINFGLFVVELLGCCGNLYWDVRNYGRVVVVTTSYPSRSRFYLYGSYANYNVTSFYFTNVYIRSTSATQSKMFALTGSLWQIYTYPLRYYNAPRPVGDKQRKQWRRYLDDVLQDATNPRDSTVLWELRYPIVINFEGIYESSLESALTWKFGRLETYGAVTLEAKAMVYVSLEFLGGLLMGRNGLLRLGDSACDTSICNWIAIGDGANLTTGQTYVGKSWNVTIGSRGRARFFRYVTIYESGVVSAPNGSGSTVDFDERVVVQSKGVVDVADATTVFHSNLSLSGALYVGKGSVTIQRRWDVFEGVVSGRGGAIWPNGGWNVTGNLDKSFSGVQINIAVPPDFSPTANGVLVDYFQYRVATDRTSAIENLHLFPGESLNSNYVLPSQFNNASAEPNVVRYEADLSRFPQNLGNSPLHLDPALVDPDTSSPDSFTFRYAARLWTFLKIETAGNYTFYFVSGQSLRYRLWIDDILKIKGSRRYLQYLNEENAGPYVLSKGYHRIRIDFIQESLDWHTLGNTLLVSYSGPGISKRLIPKEKLFYHNGTSYSKPDFRGSPSTNHGWLAGEGVILAQNSAIVNIASNCQLEILDDILWYSDNNLGGVTSFINSGTLVRRSHPGTALIYGLYVAKAGSNQQTDSGSLVFRDASISGGLAMWANAKGGSWNEAANWNPPRVPDVLDIVHVTLPGSYRIVVDDFTVVNVTSMWVGSSESDVEFVVESFARVYVIDQLSFHARNLTVNGYVEVSRLSWAGQYINGGAPASIVRRGRVVVTTSMVISNSRFRYKYLRYVVVESRGNLTYDQSYGFSYMRLHCEHCTIFNYGVYSALPLRHDLDSPLSPSSEDGFRCGLVNYGEFVMEMIVSDGLHCNWFWDLRNYGNFTVVSKRWKTLGTFNLYSTLANYGQVFFYMTNFYNPTGSSSFSKTNGSIDLYGMPSRYASLPRPVWSYQRGNWRAYLDDVYSNFTVWEVRHTSQFSITNVIDQDIYFNRVTLRGNWEFLIAASRRCRYYFGSLLSMSDLGAIVLHRYTSVDDDNRLYIQKKAAANVGRIRIGQGWTIDVGDDSPFGVSGRVLVEGGAVFRVSTGPEMVFEDTVKVELGGVMHVVGRRFLANLDFALDGQLTLLSSALIIEGRLLWTRGFLTGAHSQLSLRSGCEISGNLLKTLDGINIQLSAAKPSVRLGIIAEYFQYRVLTSLTPKMPNLIKFEGGAFDSPTSKPNVVRFESSFSRENRYYGSAPLAYLSDGWSYDTNSADSFTYNYAARLWAYIKIETSGSYKFYVSSGYGVLFRILFNGTVLYTSRQYVRFLTEETTPSIYLQVGMRLLRIEYVQLYPTWKEEGGGYLSVKYSGPGIPKQTIPNEKLFAVRDAGNGDYVAASANVNFLKDNRVCKSALTFDEIIANYSGSISHCKVSGTGALVTQNVVNVTVARSGILDIATDVDWSKPRGETLLDVRGMVIKTSGSGTSNLNTLYNVDADSGCIRSLSGKLELGSLEGEFILCVIVNGFFDVTWW